MKKKILSALFLTPFLVSAGGFQLNVQGLKAIGMGGAFTGIGSDASTVFFNPGAMTNLKGQNFTLGMSFVSPSVSLQTPENNNIDQTSGIATPFHFYYSGSLLKEKLNDKLKIGFLINNQFGSTSSFEDDWQGRNIIQNISLRTFMFQPTLSYKIHGKLSIGAGFVYSYGTFNTEKAIPVGSSATMEGKARLEGSGTGMGYNIGVYSSFLTIGDTTTDHTKFAIGINFRSKLTTELSGGDATFSDVPTSLQSTFPSTTKFDSKIVLPSVFTTGLSIKHIKERWSLEFGYDFQYTEWSTYDSLNFDFEHTETPDSKTEQAWENSITHRFGLDFTYDKKYSVRAGAYYDNTPMDEEHVSPHLPGISQLAYTFGLGYKINNKITADFGYIFQNAEREASLESANFSAKYNRIIHVFSIGVNVKL